MSNENIIGSTEISQKNISPSLIKMKEFLEIRDHKCVEIRQVEKSNIRTCLEKRPEFELFWCESPNCKFPLLQHDIISKYV